MDVTRYMNSKFHVASPGGVNSSGDPIDYNDPEVVWGSMDAALWRNRGFQGDQLNDESEIATLKKVGQYDHIWLPGEDPESDDPSMPQNTHPVTDMYGDVVYYITRL